jgi:mono/diheme cytochrome c family protein
MKTSLKLLFAAGAALLVPAVASAATAQENWTKDCQKCHAADGSASGPMGKKLKLKNYTDPAVNAAMTDEAIIAAIKDGVKDEATSKMTMPAYAAKYSPDDITALVALIRSFAKK